MLQLYVPTDTCTRTTGVWLLLPVFVSILLCATPCCNPTAATASSAHSNRFCVVLARPNMQRKTLGQGMSMAVMILAVDVAMHMFIELVMVAWWWLQRSGAPADVALPPGDAYPQLRSVTHHLSLARPRLVRHPPMLPNFTNLIQQLFPTVFRCSICSTSTRNEPCNQPLPVC